MKCHLKIKIVLALLMLLFLVSFEIDARDITGNETFNNLIISRGSTWRITKNGDVTLTVKGNFIIEEGATLTYNKANKNKFTVTINVSGNTEIYGTIDLAGKDGSKGAGNGHDAGSPGENGGHGKNLTINTREGYFKIQGKITTKGGNGGKGGDGDDGSGAHDKDSGGHGGDGGDAGKIKIVAKQFIGNSDSERGAEINSQKGSKGADGWPYYSGSYTATDGIAENPMIIIGYGHTNIWGYRFHVSKMYLVPRKSDSNFIEKNVIAPAERELADVLKEKEYTYTMDLKKNTAFFLYDIYTVHFKVKVNNNIYPDANITKDNLAPNPIRNITIDDKRGSEIFINNPTPTVKWDKVVDAEGQKAMDGTKVPVSGIKNYRFTIYSQRNGSKIYSKNIMQVTGGANYLAERTNYLADGTYQVSLQAWDNADNFNEKARLNFTIDTVDPSTPVLDAPEIGTQSFTINWQASTDNISGVANYEIEFYDEYNNPLLKGEAAATEDMGSYTVTETDYKNNFRPNQKVIYRVRAVDKAGNKSAMDEGSLVTAPATASIKTPISTGGEYGNYYVRVEIPSLEEKADRYRILRKGASQTSFKEVKSWFSITQNEEIFIDRDSLLEKHGKYEYKVETINSAGDQNTIQSSREYSVQIKNNKPQSQGLIAPKSGSKFNDRSKEYSILPFSDGDRDGLDYEFILEYMDANGDWIVSNQLDETTFNKNSDQVSIMAKNLDEGGYRWSVEVDDGYDTVTTDYYYFMTDYTAPKSPDFTLLEANIDSDGIANIDDNVLYTNNQSLTLKNIIVANDVEEVRVYEDDRLLTTAVPINQKISNLEVTLNSIEGRREIRLTAIDDVGNESSARVITTIYDQQAPNNPSDFTYKGGLNSLTINWNQPTDQGESGVDYYRLEYKRINQQDATFIAINKVNNTQYSITGLDYNEPIWVRIKAVDKAGNESTSWLTKSNGYYGYSLPEEGVILNQSFNYGESIDGGYDHTVNLTLKPVKAAAFKIRWQELNSASNPIQESEWITNSNQESFISQVKPHKQYNYWIVTRNGRGEEVKSDIYGIQVPNHQPTKPIIDQEIYKYINHLPIELRTARVIDYDQDLLSYYFTVVDKAGNPIVNKEQSNIENGDKLSYQLLASDLVDGQSYCWWVEVEDGYGANISSEIITSTVDLIAPSINIIEANEVYLPELRIEVQVNDKISGIKEIKYYWNEEDNPTTINLGAGIYQKDISIEALHGNNILYLQAVDHAGNETNLLSRRYLIDKTKPQIEDFSLAGQLVDGQYYTTNSNSLYGSWEFIEPETGIDYYKYAVITKDEVSQIDSLAIDRFVTVDTNEMEGDFDQVIEISLEEGREYYLVIEGVNKVGRSSGLIISKNGVVIDSKPPVITDIQLDNVVDYGSKVYLNDLAGLSMSADISDTGSGIAQTGYALAKDINQLETVVWYTSLAELKNLAQVEDGESYYLAIKAKDKLGQEMIEYSKPIIIDQTAPEINKLIAGNELEIDSPSDLYEVKPGYKIPITLEISDESDLANITYSIGRSPGDNSVSNEIYPDKNGWIELDTNLIQQFIIDEELSDGTYYLNIKVKNKANLVTEFSSNPIKVNSNIQPRPEVIDDGAFTANNKELHFSWNFTDTPDEVVAYEYQIVDKESNLVKNWQQVAIQTAGNSQSLIVENLDLEDNMKYFIKVRALYQESSYSEVGLSDGIVVDTTVPTGLLIDDGEYIAGNKLHLKWEAEDNESPISKYQVKVGTSPGANDITGDWIELDNSGEGIVEGLELTTNQVYFTTLRVLNSAGLIAETTSDGFRVDKTPPPVPMVLDGGSYNNEKYLAFDWNWSKTDSQSGIKEYQYALLTKREVTNNTNWQSAALNREVELSEGLIDGQKYYLAVKAINGAGMISIGYSDGILIDTSKPNPPEVDDFVDYQLIDNNSLSAHFTASDDESGIDHYEYSIGTFNNRDLIISNKGFSGEDITEAGLSLDKGEIYFTTVKAINGAGLVSMESMSDGIKIIDGSPEIYNVKDYGDFTTFADKIIVSWDYKSSDVPIDYYEVAVSTSANESNFNWTKVTKQQLVITPELIGLESFEDGMKYYVYIRGINRAGIKTPTSKLGKTDGIVVDSTPPSKPQIKHDDDYTTTDFKIEWKSIEDDTEIVAYRYAIGTSRGGTEITNGWQYVSTNQELYSRVLKLDLNHNQRYYLTVQSKNIAGLWSELGYDDGVIADLTSPLIPVLEYNNNYITSLEEIRNITWESDDPETGITGYRYQVVQSKEGLDWTGIEEYETTKKQLTIDIGNLNLIEDEKYYVGLQVRNRLGVWSKTGFSQQLTVDTILPEIYLENQDKEMVTNSGQIDVPWQVSEEAIVYYRVIRPDGSMNPEVGYHKQDGQANILYNYQFDELLEGSYKLELYGVDLAGNTGQKVTQEIRLNAKPRINVGSDLATFKGRVVDFAAMVSDPDGEVVKYIWSFGDGSEVSNQKAPAHFYSELGSYQVTLTCIDNDGGESSDSLWIEVTNTTEGSLVMDESWFGEMNITGTVIVPTWINLTIEPGTKITFPRDTSLIIYGNLKVEGIDSKQIIFTTSSIIEEWEGIKIDSSISQISVEESIIENAKRGITLNESNGEFNNLTLRNNKVGIHLINSSPVIQYSQILNNELYGIKEDGDSNPELLGNYFDGNKAGDYYDSRLTILIFDELLDLNR
ncbi:hypothetical protein U472_08215 [Orenia metallireducens]|uniref:Fibronectin type III domain-containing protein n=1 Tax=Orenia metallireducens TaxID=1413210 RepID=A0A1C0A6Z6_9FIRM|nr:fibronectin type III domain-containing protein [Orenia metallireducens]OCL26002.1 hypothetical protein U472_08215 [Orenia metallireducens]